MAYPTSKMHQNARLLWPSMAVGFVSCLVLYFSGNFANPKQHNATDAIVASLVQSTTNNDDGPGTVTFALQNLSEKRVEVVGVRPSCSCLTLLINGPLLLPPFGMTQFDMRLTGQLPKQIAFVLVTDDSKAIKCSVSFPDNLSIKKDR